jgi:hypothetical protein
VAVDATCAVKTEVEGAREGAGAGAAVAAAAPATATGEGAAESAAKAVGREGAGAGAAVAAAAPATATGEGAAESAAKAVGAASPTATATPASASAVAPTVAPTVASAAVPTVVASTAVATAPTAAAAVATPRAPFVPPTTWFGAPVTAHFPSLLLCGELDAADLCVGTPIDVVNGARSDAWAKLHAHVVPAALAHTREMAELESMRAELLADSKDVLTKWNDEFAAEERVRLKRGDDSAQGRAVKKLLHAQADQLRAAKDQHRIENRCALFFFFSSLFCLLIFTRVLLRITFSDIASRTASRRRLCRRTSSVSRTPRTSCTS